MHIKSTALSIFATYGGMVWYGMVRYGMGFRQMYGTYGYGKFPVCPSTTLNVAKLYPSRKYMVRLLMYTLYHSV